MAIAVTLSFWQNRKLFFNTRWKTIVLNMYEHVPLLIIVNSNDFVASQITAPLVILKILNSCVRQPNNLFQIINVQPHQINRFEFPDLAKACILRSLVLLLFTSEITLFSTCSAAAMPLTHRLHLPLLFTKIF